MCHVADVARTVPRRSESMILLAAEATNPEPEYGWIEPGETVAWTARGPLRRVRRFMEKPSPAEADALFHAGCLWNMFVFAARVSSLVDAGRTCVPLLHDRLSRMELFLGTQHELWAMRQACMLAPTANFSRSVLQDTSLSLGVSAVPALTWCDLGTPERVARTWRRLGVAPAWLAS